MNRLFAFPECRMSLLGRRLAPAHDLASGIDTLRRAETPAERLQVSHVALIPEKGVQLPIGSPARQCAPPDHFTGGTDVLGPTDSPSEGAEVSHDALLPEK